MQSIIMRRKKSQFRVLSKVLANENKWGGPYSRMSKYFLFRGLQVRIPSVSIQEDVELQQFSGRKQVDVMVISTINKLTNKLKNEQMYFLSKYCISKQPTKYPPFISPNIRLFLEKKSFQLKGAYTFICFHYFNPELLSFIFMSEFSFLYLYESNHACERTTLFFYISLKK